jgi:hypothetical protein
LHGAFNVDCLKGRAGSQVEYQQAQQVALEKKRNNSWGPLHPVCIASKGSNHVK